MNKFQEYNILYIRKEKKFVKICSWTFESCLLWHIFP